MATHPFRIVFPAFLVVILLQGTTAWLVMSHHRDVELQNATNLLIASFDPSRDAIDRTLLQIDVMLTSLPILLDTASTKDRGRMVLQTQRSQNGILRDVMVIAQTGEVIVGARAGSQNTMSSKTIEFLEDVSRQSSLGTQVSAAYRSDANGEWSILFARRIRLSSHGAVIAVAEASIPALTALVAGTSITPGMRVLITNSSKIMATIPHDVTALQQIRQGDTDDTISKTEPLFYRTLELTLSRLKEDALTDWYEDLYLGIIVGSTIVLLELIAALGLVAHLRSRALAHAASERARELLAQAHARAEAALASKTMFIANMNHELRTPLNAVIGYSDILSNELFGPMGEARYREYATQIHNSGKHLLSIVEDILDISMIDLGERELALEKVPLAQAIEEGSSLFSTETMARSIDLRVTGITPDDVICSDSRAFRQILFNLLSNAIKFSPNGATIEIRRCAEGREEFTTLSVIDQGPGIAEDDIKKIGEKFFRAQWATDNAIQGIGLGLSISKTLVEQMGGNLLVKSQIGVGSTFTIEIPNTPPERIDSQCAT